MLNHIRFVKTVVNATRVLCHQSLKFKQFPRWSSSTTFKRKKMDDLNKLFNHIKDNPYNLNLLTTIYDSIDYAQVSSKDACTLLNLCGEAVADSPRYMRDEACQKIYRNIVGFKSDLNIYHTYIQVCTENSVLLNTKEFLQAMKDSPSSVTYKLLLRNVCEKGDINQALEILEAMKLKSMLVDEDIFNNLVLAHAIQRGLKGAESVLSAMQVAHVTESIQTKMSIIKGVIQNGNFHDFINVVDNFHEKLEKSELITVIEALGLNDRVSWLNKIEPLYVPETISRDFINSLKKTCIHLVNMGKYNASFDIYKHFVKPDQDENYGFFLLSEMILCQANADKVIEFAKDLSDSDANPYILERLTEVSIKHKFFDLSWKLLENLTERRPHYIWPLLVAASETSQYGILEAISKLKRLNVNLDAEGFQNYVFPVCDINNLGSSRLLLEHFKTEGYTIRHTLSPLLAVLLKNDKIELAASLCNVYNVPISLENFTKQLSLSWYSTKDKKSSVTLLKKYCESNVSDAHMLLCEFIAETLQLCKDINDYHKYNELIKEIIATGMKLDATSVENMRKQLSQIPCQQYSEIIIRTLDGIIDFSLTPIPTPFIPHPREMSVEELECHLIELQEKQMNIRGTVRRLVLEHSRLGNTRRVQELKELMKGLNFKESPGMKSAAMNTFLREGMIDEALEIYRELKELKMFHIDTYKLIDLCCLLVKADRFNEAMDLLKGEQVVRKTMQQSILRNCLKLLKAFKDAEQQYEMFKFLTSNGYCTISNVLLGPLISIHLNSGNVQKALDTYMHLLKKYHCTPMQIELFKEVVKTPDNDDMLEKLTHATTSVHGILSTEAIVIAAFAENGMRPALETFLAGLKDPSIKFQLKKQCERWVQQQKPEPLRLLIECSMKFNRKIIDMELAGRNIMKIYSITGNYKDALEVFNFLERNRVYNAAIQNQIVQLLKDNKQKLPARLRG